MENASGEVQVSDPRLHRRCTRVPIRCGQGAYQTLHRCHQDYTEGSVTIRFEDSPREGLYGGWITDSGSPWHDYRYRANAIYSTREETFKTRGHGHINHEEGKVKPEGSRYRRAEVLCRGMSEPQSRGSRDGIETERVTYCHSVIEEQEGDTTGGSNQGGFVVAVNTEPRPLPMHIPPGADSSGHTPYRLLDNGVGSNTVTVTRPTRTTRLIRGQRLLVPRNTRPISYNTQRNGFSASRPGFVRRCPDIQSWGSPQIIYRQHGHDVRDKSPRKQIPASDAGTLLTASLLVGNGREYPSRISAVGLKSICQPLVTAKQGIRLPPTRRRWSGGAVLGRA